MGGRDYGIRAAFFFFFFKQYEVKKKMSVLRFKKKSVACNVLFFSLSVYLSPHRM